MPSFFMIIGVWVSSIDWTARSPSRLIEPELYPGQQKILVNQDIHDRFKSDTSTQTLINSLPGKQGFWDVTYNDSPRG